MVETGLMTGVGGIWGGVLLDPDRLARLAVATLLGGVGLRVDHHTEDSWEAAERCQEPGVGVLVTEVRIPGRQFQDLARQVVKTRPHIRVVVLTSEEDPRELMGAVAAGACAVLSKFSDPAATCARILATTRGGLLLDEITAPLVFGGNENRDDQLVVLTAREAMILQLVAEGRTLHAVSRELNVAESTVKSQAAKAAARLGVKNSKEAARRAVSLGLIVADTGVL